MFLPILGCLKVSEPCLDLLSTLPSEHGWINQWSAPFVVGVCLGVGVEGWWGTDRSGISDSDQSLFLRTLFEVLGYNLCLP